jgi:hypothetical protein
LVCITSTCSTLQLIIIARRSFFIALHAFSTLFRRGKSSVMGVCLKIAFGWAFVLTNVLLGPFVLEDTQMKGPFLGISGLWCWLENTPFSYQSSLSPLTQDH